MLAAAAAVTTITTTTTTKIAYFHRHFAFFDAVFGSFSGEIRPHKKSQKITNLSLLLGFLRSFFTIH
jgi:hypothetical protein